MRESRSHADKNYFSVPCSHPSSRGIEIESPEMRKQRFPGALTVLRYNRDELGDAERYDESLILTDFSGGLLGVFENRHPTESGLLLTSGLQCSVPHFCRVLVRFQHRLAGEVQVWRTKVICFGRATTIRVLNYFLSCFWPPDSSTVAVVVSSFLFRERPGPEKDETRSLYDTGAE